MIKNKLIKNTKIQNGSSPQIATIMNQSVLKALVALSRISRYSTKEDNIQSFWHICFLPAYILLDKNKYEYQSKLYSIGMIIKMGTRPGSEFKFTRLS